MDPLVKDLLQLGFSFAVAGYLLVTQTALVRSLVELLRTQTTLLEMQRAALVRVEDLLQVLVTSFTPARGSGGD